MRKFRKKGLFILKMENCLKKLDEKRRGQEEKRNFWMKGVFSNSKIQKALNWPFLLSLNEEKWDYDLNACIKLSI